MPLTVPVLLENNYHGALLVLRTDLSDYEFVRRILRASSFTCTIKLTFKLVVRQGN